MQTELLPGAADCWGSSSGTWQGAGSWVQAAGCRQWGPSSGWNPPGLVLAAPHNASRYGAALPPHRPAHEKGKVNFAGISKSPTIIPDPTWAPK